jgi:RNA polymerase sigma-70 factor (ECF subfamily)
VAPCAREAADASGRGRNDEKGAIRESSDDVSSARSTSGDGGLRGSLVAIRRTVSMALSRLLGANDPEREDLEQTVMEAVLDSLDRGNFRGESSLVTWVATIARNVAVDALRARHRRRQVFARVDGDGEERSLETIDDRCPPQRLEARHDVTRVERVLASLGPRKARIVILHDALGYDLAEVAEMLGLSRSAAQSHLVRTRKRILELLRASPQDG